MNTRSDMSRMSKRLTTFYSGITTKDNNSENYEKGKEKIEGKKGIKEKDEGASTYPRGPYMLPCSAKDRAKGASVDGGTRYGSSAVITRKVNLKSASKP